MIRLTTERLISYINENLNIKKNVSTEENISEQANEIFRELDFGDFQNLSFLDGEFNELINSYSLDLNRYGVISTETINNVSDANISLYFSLIMIIKNEYKTMQKSQQLLYLQKFVEKMLTDISSHDLFKKFEYEAGGWNKNEFIAEIKKFIIGKRTIKFLADYLLLNIWILNYETDELLMCHSNNKVNKFRNNIIIFYQNNVYEPVSYQNIYLLDNECPLINYLYENIDDVINLRIDSNKDKEFEFGFDDLTHLSSKKDVKINGKDNWLLNRIKYNNEKTNQELINKEENKPAINSKIENVEDVNDQIDKSKLTKSVFSKKDVSKLEYSDDDLEDVANNEVTEATEQHKSVEISMKMKLDELQQIATKFNINLTNIANGKKKNKTKEQLIIDINNVNK